MCLRARAVKYGANMLWFLEYIARLSTFDEEILEKKRTSRLLSNLPDS